jgi:hypothetical protein
VLNQLAPASDLPIPPLDPASIAALIPDTEVAALAERIKELGDGIGEPRRVCRRLFGLSHAAMAHSSAWA